MHIVCEKASISARGCRLGRAGAQIKVSNPPARMILGLWSVGPGARSLLVKYFEPQSNYNLVSDPSDSDGSDTQVVIWALPPPGHPFWMSLGLLLASHDDVPLDIPWTPFGFP